MRVVEPHEFKAVKHPKKKRKLHGRFVAAVFIVVVSALGLYSLDRKPESGVKSTQSGNQQPELVGQATPALPAAEPVRVYHYCVNVRGVSRSELPEFVQQIDWTLNLNRGWSLSNKIAFKKAEVGCDFTIWLSSPGYMASFGGICDSEWSCRVGNSVVANFEKWQNASEAWQQKEGNIDLYRVMLINHEVGHWFGFEHKHCAGPGQPASVMQQQSIDLEGCKFNPWPTNEERVELQKLLNL